VAQSGREWHINRGEALCNNVNEKCVAGEEEGEERKRSWEKYEIYVALYKCGGGSGEGGEDMFIVYVSREAEEALSSAQWRK